MDAEEIIIRKGFAAKLRQLAELLEFGNDVPEIKIDIPNNEMLFTVKIRECPKHVTVEASFDIDEGDLYVCSKCGKEETMTEDEYNEFPGGVYCTCSRNSKFIRKDNDQCH